MHEARFRVYYEDTDAFGIMYHARHIAFAERARADALRSLGAPPSEFAAAHGLGFVVRALNVVYRASLHLDDEVRVCTELLARRGASCSLRQVLKREDVIAAELIVELACVALDVGKPMRIPACMARALDQLALTLEDQAH